VKDFFRLISIDHFLFCNNKKGLNSSGSQKLPFRTKLSPKFLALPNKLGLNLPNKAYVNPVDTAIITDLTGISPIGKIYYLLNYVI